MAEMHCDTEKKGCCQGLGAFLGRLLLSLIFISAGLGKIFDFSSSVEYVRSLGLGWPEGLTVISLLFELIGGLMILLGWHARIGAIILMIFLIPTTFLAHNFWHYSGMEMHMQLGNFMKNVAVFGGLILLLTFGPGKWSFDACCSKK